MTTAALRPVGEPVEPQDEAAEQAMFDELIAAEQRIERHPQLDREVCEAAAEVLAQRIKVHIGSSVTVRLDEPGALPRSEGKYKRVYDLR